MHQPLAMADPAADPSHVPVLPALADNVAFQLGRGLLRTQETRVWCGMVWYGGEDEVFLERFLFVWLERM